MLIYMTSPVTGNREDFNIFYCPLYTNLEAAKEDIIDDLKSNDELDLLYTEKIEWLKRQDTYTPMMGKKEFDYVILELEVFNTFEKPDKEENTKREPIQTKVYNGEEFIERLLGNTI